MGIRSDDELDRSASRFTADSANETLRELEDQYARGEIEKHAYFMKKQALVRILVKSTTTPKRRYRDEYDGD